MAPPGGLISFSAKTMGERLPLPLAVYLGLARRAGPLIRLTHWLRKRSGKDDPSRGQERFGRASVDRSDGPLVWIHAASVGETTSVLPLIEALTADGRKVLLTTVTRTSAELAQGRLPKGAVHQFACYDHPDYLNRFLDHWQPDLALVVESEVWPATYLAVAARGIPLGLVNGRMSVRSFNSWSRVPASSTRIFGALSVALAQSEPDGMRLTALGCPDVRLPGNLKFDGDPLPVEVAARAELLEQMEGRASWLAALTHPGEDAIAIAAHARLLTENPELLLLLVPRHPARGEELARLCEERGLSFSRRSQNGVISSETQVYIGDTIGEMGLFYSLCQTIFLAGSFSDVGGHNPLEPLRAGGALITGPKVANARSTYKALWQADAALRLDKPDEIGPAVQQLLHDEERRRALATNGQKVIAEASGALSRTLRILADFLPPAGDARRTYDPMPTSDEDPAS
ncbi:3-deoxy-D-manno-octulosonic acid transferase [Roseibium sp.]|uniref:3-deoxy-D-manno-octulosonic acid transferase n=1 Tax=Roseibium sp. TaxID=1936156 RepID=UPI003A96D784